MTYLFFLAGLGLLIIGAEILVRGASRLAISFGISPLVVGLTVVAFGTSSPELAVSVNAALDDQAGIAIGNVVGSNIFNVLFILGLAALITPLVVAQQLIRLDVPLMIVVSVLVLLMSLDGKLTRFEGLFLFSGLIVYTVFLIYQSRREKQAIAAEYDQAIPAPTNRWWIDILLVGGGLALLVLGSNWLVDAAVTIARQFGVSDLVIGLTIIAAGTSMPEVVTSVVASLRGQRDIAVGNVIGSNLFNLMGVLGLTSLIAPSGIAVAASAIQFDIPVMVAVAVACLPIFFSGHLIARWEGGLFFGFYIAYTTYLIMAAFQHAALEVYSNAMLWFVLPLTAITLIVVAWRNRRSNFS